MRRLLLNYTFVPGTRTVTLTDVPGAILEGLLLITNVTSNIIIYHFADPAKGAAPGGPGAFVLDFDTSSMSSSDKLQIYYDDGATLPVNVTNTEEFGMLIRRLVKMNEPCATQDANQRQMISAVLTSGTLTTLGTLTTVTNPVPLGNLATMGTTNYPAQMVAIYQNNAAWAAMVRSRIT